MKTSSLLYNIKIWSGIVMMVAFLFEMLFFPTWSNFLGGIMAVICWLIFTTFFLKRYIIVNYPFSFLVYVSMFLYRYLPLIATIIENKPITFGMELPIATFIHEIILFIILSIAFYWACSKKFPKSNLIQRTLYKNGFYKTNSLTTWTLGIVGLLSMLYTFSSGEISYGNSLGKFIYGLRYLTYSPIILLFPALIKGVVYSNKRLVWFYLFGVMILNIASNSREALITPIFIYVILFFINAVKQNLKLSNVISPKLLLFAIVFFVFGLNFLNDISNAMLYTRKIRADVGKTELFTETIKVYQNKPLMNNLRKITESVGKKVTNYEEGWDESYLDNFMLNRYANMRISDQTLYYTYQKGLKNKEMRIFFNNRILANLPTPILRLLGFTLDKKDMEKSAGDVLIGIHHGFRVTSHVGIGLVTFGYFYFIIQLIVSFLMFKLLNTFIQYSKTRVIYYAPFALIQVFTILGLHRNTEGVAQDLSWVIRGYLEGVLTYIIVFWGVSYFLSFFKKPSVVKVIKN